MKKSKKQETKSFSNPVLSSPYLIIIGLIIAVYSQVMTFDYTGFDDDFLIVNNIENLQNWDNLSKVFTENSFLSDAVYGFYRPMQTISFMIDVSISDGSLLALHLTNFLLHLLTTILLYRLFLKLNIEKLFSLILTLLFAVNPLFISNLAWLPARGDLLITLFGILSFINFINYIEKKSYPGLALSAVFLFLAFLSKETALTIPALFVLYSILVKKINLKQILLPFNTWVSAYVIWFLLGSNVVNQLPENQIFGLIPLLENLATIPEYIAKFFIPVNLSLLPTYSLSNTVIGLVLIAGLVVLLLKSDDKKKLLFGILWFVIIVFPGMLYSRNYPNTTQFYQYLDHRAYLAILGVLFILPELLSMLSKKLKERAIFIISIVVVIIYALTSFMSVKHYKDPESFFTEAINDNPQSSVSMFLYANFLKDKLSYQEAVNYYSEAININPNYSEALNNRGALYAMGSQFQAAINDLSKAIAINPNIPDGYYNRALSYQALGKFEEALSDFNRALESNPKDRELLLSIANIYSAMGLKDKAIESLSEIILKYPNYHQAYYNRANTYAEMDSQEQAIEDFGRAIQLNPNYTNAYLNRGIARYKIGDYKTGCLDWQKAAELGSNPALQMLKKYCQ